MKDITIIEDDEALNNGIVLALKNESYTFHQYYALQEYNADEATDLIRNKNKIQPQKLYCKNRQKMDE